MATVTQPSEELLDPALLPPELRDADLEEVRRWTEQFQQPMRAEAHAKAEKVVAAPGATRVLACPGAPWGLQE